MREKNGQVGCPSAECDYKMSPQPKGFRLDMDFKAAVKKDGTLVLEGYASTWGKDRDGDTVADAAFGKSLGQYLTNNPILLLNHDRAKAIGYIT